MGDFGVKLFFCSNMGVGVGWGYTKYLDPSNLVCSTNINSLKN